MARALTTALQFLVAVVGRDALRQLVAVARDALGSKGDASAFALGAPQVSSSAS
jgi:hypothetical protein